MGTPLLYLCLTLLVQASLCFNANYTNCTEPDFRNLKLKYQNVTESIHERAIARLDELGSCAKTQGREPTCTRDKVVYRKE